MPFIFWMGLAALRMATPLQKNFMLFMKSTPKFALVTYVHQHLFEKARFFASFGEAAKQNDARSVIWNGKYSWKLHLENRS